MRSIAHGRALAAIALALLTARGAAVAETANGNDMCLYLSEAVEATNTAEVTRLTAEAQGINYYFRYLEIMEMESGRENNQPFVNILAREPSSYFRMQFRVDRKVSLTTLLQEPQTKVGSGIAVLGRTAQIDPEGRLIVLDPVIVKHKDVLTPKTGKEMLGELDPTARYYSYTAVPGKPVAVSFADKDLIENNRGRIPEFEASLADKEAWADFLLAELAKREKRRAMQLQNAKERAGIMRDSTNAPALRK